MPSITFALPHWFYWLGLLFIPLWGMYMIRKQKGKKLTGLTKPIAYLLWLFGGFVGLHRLYLRSSLGMIYIPLFIVLMLSNVEVKITMDHVSAAKNNLSIADFDVVRAQDAVKKGAEGAKQKLEKAEQALETAKQALVEAQAGRSKWNLITGGLGGVIALMLLIDALLMPGLLRRCAKLEAEEAKLVPEQVTTEPPVERRYSDPTMHVHVPFFDFIDKINGYTAEFVCFWSIIAVFVYYFEVLSRYVFNSPTNWAHEGMFLMFGMQYMLAAGWTLREDGHVRVDVIYVHLPDRAKAVLDLITSSLFFVFALALLWTGWLFLADSLKVWEVSFTEWAIQYWPIKATMVVGPLLLTVQGISRLVKDVVIITGRA
jgi:TRAP-type mannitol/chloroaromatic compound transport system permease small subunit